METQELATIDQQGKQIAVETVPRTAKELITQRHIIQDILANVMQAGVDYDVIPGTKNKSLLKPGTEKILATFRLAADPQIIDLSSDDVIRYRVHASLRSPSGVFVGTGIGECSSNEEKYKWRAPVCEEEWDEADKMRRRHKWKKNWKTKKNEKVFQVRTEPADIANTVLKMAKKRALADAVLTATACSDIFEPIPEGEDYDTGKPPARPSRSAKGAIDAAPVVAKLEAAAKDGTEALESLWGVLPADEKNAVGKDYWRIKKIADGVAPAK